MTDSQAHEFLTRIKQRIRVSRWLMLTPAERKMKPADEAPPLRVFVVADGSDRRFAQVAVSRAEAVRLNGIGHGDGNPWMMEGVAV